MKKLFTLIAVAAMAFAAQATDVTVCDGTTTDEYAPVYGYNFETDQHNQMQYPAAELGLPAGAQITALKFYTSTPDAVNALGGSVTISLANMEDVTPWTTDAWGGLSGNLLDVAVTAVATVAPAADADGVWTITFDAPFTYEGGALLVDVQSVAGDWKNTAFFGKEMGAYYVMATYGYAGSKKGQTLLPKATITYEAGGEEPGITTLAQANALEDAAEFTFNGNAVVTAWCMDSVYLRDESGYGMIANPGVALEPGQVLSQGWSATKTSNDGWVSYINAANLTASGETNAELAAPQKLTGALEESMINAYVYAENVHKGFFPIRNFKVNGETIYLTGNGDQPATGDYNIYGVVWKVNGQLQLQPIRWEEYVEPQPVVDRGNVNGVGGVDMDDLTALINYLLDSANYEINQANAAACNSLDNTTVDMDDLTALINYLLSGSWAD